MRLIINTNRIIAALVKDSYSRSIIMSRRFELVSPNFSAIEVKKHRNEVLLKSHLSNIEFDKLLTLLFSKIYFLDDSIIRKKEKQARKIMDKIDPDDSPFIAAALAVANDGIWSDDPHFMMQKSIKVWRTKDLSKP